MVIVINDDRVSDVDAYIPLAQAFAADAAANDKGCLSMEVLTDPGVQGDRKSTRLNSSHH